MLAEPIVATLVAIEALEALAVPYLIGGSLASAVHGVVRTTLDAHLVADLRVEHARPLAGKLSGSFYVDVEMILDAVRHQSHFNVVHLETVFKVDVFIPKQRPFDHSQLRRRREVVIATDPERSAFVASPEDTILAKLEWYLKGDQVSERPWRDVLGVLKVQAGTLDLDYLHQWAAESSVAPLLERALSESSTGRF